MSEEASAPPRRRPPRTEAEHLEQAERHIAENQARIAKQLDLIDRLRAAGADTAEAETFLANLERTRTLALKHRAMILAEIRRQSGGTRPGTAP